MATPREVLNDVLREFENVYGYSLYSALPNSKTSTGKSGTGTTSKDILYAQVESDLLKEITTSLGGKGNSPLAVTQLIMSNIADNIELSGSTATGKQAAGSTRKGKPTLNISYGRNTGIDAEAGAISGVLTSGVTGSLAKRATQTTEGAVEAEGLARRSEGANQLGVVQLPKTGGGTTSAVPYSNANLEAQAKAMAGDYGSYLPYKDGAYWIVYNEDKGINAVFGADSNGTLEYKAPSVDQISKDDVSIKYTFGYDLDGKQYRMDNASGDIEVKETLSGEFGFPGQGEWRSGTIRMTERAGEEAIDWITYTDNEGQTWQQDANDPKNRTKISNAQQEIGFSTRFNPATQQYETVRIDVRTGDMITAGGDKGDGFLGQSYDSFADTRDFDQRADQFGASERRLGSQFGQTFGEDVRQFNQSLGENQRQFNMGYGLDRDRFGEDVRQFNTGFGETQRQFDTTESRMEKTLAANNYFQGLEELGRNYRTLVQTSPQLANAATNQGELIRNILTNGGDVLARTYFTRGGISPLPEITQADLINNLNTEVQNIAKFENASIDAENRRRTQADSRREREEFTQFRAANAADARAAYGRYTNEMVPTTREDYDAGGFSSAQATYDTQRAAADKRIADLNLVSQFISAPNAVDSSGTAFQDVATQQADIQAQIAAANAGVMGAPNPGAFTSFSTTTPTPMSYEDWVTTSQFGAPQMGFEQWKTNVGPSFAPSQLLNVPEVPMPRATTQAELIANSRATTPPAVQSVLSGQMPTPLQFGGLPLPTFQQLQALTPTEQEMLNSRLMTEFNVPLSDVAFQSQRSFGAPSVDRNKDLARFRGYAV